MKRLNLFGMEGLNETHEGLSIYDPINYDSKITSLSISFYCVA